MPGGLHGRAGDRDTEMVSLLAGRTTIGTAATDIVLQGAGLAPQHCYIENVRGTLTLHPCGNACAIDGVPLQRPMHLTQGRNRLWFTGAFAHGVVPLSIGVFEELPRNCMSQLAFSWSLSSVEGTCRVLAQFESWLCCVYQVGWEGRDLGGL